MTAIVIRFPAYRTPGPRACDTAGNGREIARLREITAESANNELLGNGPAHPDARLLDLCAAALHLLTHGNEALARCHAEHHGPNANASFEEYRRDISRAKPLLRVIAKLPPAATAAGIYAKALVVRSSRTGAPALAMTLAADLIACPGLRASLCLAHEELTADLP
jgi:hypothetical protein